MKKLAGFLALVMVLTMVSVPTFAAEEVETDPAKISMATNFVLFEDDFSDDSQGWTLKGPAAIKNGKLYLRDVENTVADGDGSASYSMQGYDISGNWYVYFKLNAGNGGISQGRADDIFGLQFGGGTNQQGRVYLTLRRGGVMVPWESGVPAAAKAVSDSSFTDRIIPDWSTAPTFEYLLAFRNVTLSDGETYPDCFDIWRRTIDVDGIPTSDWEKANNKRETYWHKEGSNNGLYVYSMAAKNAESRATMDDVRVYQGSYATLTDPVIAGGAVTTSGTYAYGYQGIGAKRRLTRLTAVYDKEHGYTKEIMTGSYQATGGSWLEDLMQRLSFNEETDTVASMMWDSVETGIPLTAAKDTVNRNTADDKFPENEDVFVDYKTNFNEVNISGYVGMGEKHITASLTDKATGELVAVVQTKGNGVGKVETKLAIDPTRDSGTYTLRLEKENAAAESFDVDLYTNDILGDGIDSSAEMKAFLKNYSSAEVQAKAEEEGFAEQVYEEYLALAGENAGAVELYAFREYLDPAISNTIAKRECLKALNQELGAEIVAWGNLRTLITTTYADVLRLTAGDLEKIVGVSDQKALYSALKGPYADVMDVKADLMEAVGRLSSGSVGGGTVGGGTTGGFGGGGASGGGGGIIGGGGNTIKGTAAGGGAGAGAFTPAKPIDTNKDVVAGLFKDLDTVTWAEESINQLSKLGVVNGESEGVFSPNRAVTREEFLKMAMAAAGIPASDGTMNFADVDQDAWYYGYVAAAYNLGIITGQDENTFGIGQEITRADMAVILKRMLEATGVKIIAEENAFVFEDFDTIPKYARESITLLCQAGLMNGVGGNRFAADASATRAESAVAIYRIYNYMAERR